MGRVFPLCFEDSWVFGAYEKEVASVFLATDGMLETLFPVLLRDQPVDIYVALAQYFMDRDGLGFEELGESAVEKKMSEFVSSISGEQVNDDKTVVVLCDNSIEVTRQSDEYYFTPDWQKLEQVHREAYMREAYPHLFKGNNISNAETNIITNDETVEKAGDEEQHPENNTTSEESARAIMEVTDKHISNNMSFRKNHFQRHNKSKHNKKEPL